MTVDELPEHRHAENINGFGNDAWNDKFGPLVSRPNKSTGYWCGYSAETNAEWITGAYRVYSEWTGSNKPHNVMQPCRAVYIWFRTA